MKYVVLGPLLILMWLLLPLPDASAAELPRVLTWRVFDHANGDAIVGATVSVYFNEQGAPAQVAQTDRVGRVSIALPPEFVHWDLVEGEWQTRYMRIETAAAGYVRMQTVWAHDDYEASVPPQGDLRYIRDPEDLRPVFATIALRRIAPVEGKVVDQSGKPVAGAKVIAEVGKQQICACMNNTCWDTYDNKPIAIEVRTDKDGHWRYENVPAPISGEQIEVDITHDDYFSQHHAYRRSNEPTDLDHQGTQPESYEKFQQGATIIAMQHASGVAVRIRDSKKNIITDPAFCTDVYDQTRKEPCIKFDLKTKRHRITGIPRGTYMAMISAPGFQPVMQTFKAKERYPKIDVTLQPGASVRGRLVDQFGAPISNADIRLFPLSENPGYYVKQQTDFDGKFELSGVPGKKVVVEYNSRRMQGSSRITFSIYPRPEPYTLTCPLESSIRGLVLDAVTSEPIRQYNYMCGVEGDSGSIFWSEPDSKTQYEYHLRNVCKGRYRLLVVSDGYEPTTSPTIEVKNVHTVQNIYLKRRAEGLRARILDPDGKPVAGRIVLCSFGSATSLQERIDNIGKFAVKWGDYGEDSDSHGEIPVLDKIRSSDLLIIAGSKGYAILPRQKKSVMQCTVRLTPFARIEGDAWLGGKPAAGVRIEFAPKFASALWFSSFTYTDAKGHYSLNCMSCPGRLTFDPDSPLKPNNPSTYLLQVVKTVEPKLGDRLRIDIRDGATIKGKIIPPADAGDHWMTMNDLVDDSKCPTTYTFRVDRGGSFFILGVQPGKYQLDVRFDKLKDDWRTVGNSTRVEKSFSIPDGAGDRILD